MRLILFLLMLLILALAIGCAGHSHGEDVILPSSTEPLDEEGIPSPEEISRIQDGAASPVLPFANHVPLGYWQILFDPDEVEFDVVGLRGSDFHLNIVSYLQHPNPIGLSIQVIQYKPSEGILDFQISLTHPYPDSNLRVFDLRGIVMGGGDTVASLSEPSLVYNSPEGTRLANADGYTRWWNAPEFKTPSIFGYVPGALGIGTFVPVTTINPYKYFSDPLGPDDPVVPGVNLSNRGTFSTDGDPPALKRKYELRLPVTGGEPVWLFQYAVDANWAVPTGSSPAPKPIEEYPPWANCPEAFHITVDTTGTSAYYANEYDYGGDINLSIEIFDWGAASNPEGIEGEIEQIIVESQTLFDEPVVVPIEALPGNQETSGIFKITVPGVHPTGIENQEILVTVQSKPLTTYISPIGFPAYPEDAHIAAYHLVNIPISGENPVDPGIELVSPNGGDFWTITAEETVEWNWTGGIPFIKIYLSLDGGQNWPLLLANDILNTGTYNVPQVGLWPSEMARVRIVDALDPLVSDESDADFSIGFVEKTITLQSPNGGEIWFTGKSGAINWDSTGSIGNVKILLSEDSGGAYEYVIEDPIPDSGFYVWENIPFTVVGDLCRIKVIDADDANTFDCSDADFSIKQEWILVDKPNGGEIWKVDDEQEITWLSGDGISDVKIEYSIDSGFTFPYQVVESTPNDGSHPWTVPGTLSTQARIKITATSDPGLFDTSNNDFVITDYIGDITVVSPDGDEEWWSGDTEEITWNSGADIENVNILLKMDLGGSFDITVAEAEINDGSFTWDSIPAEYVGTTNWIRIEDAGSPDVYDTSNKKFTIKESMLTLHAPNGEEEFIIDGYSYVTWQGTAGSQNMRLDYSTDGGLSYPNVIIESTPNIGIYNWLVPDDPTYEARIRVQTLDGPYLSDESDADFTIMYDTSWDGWALTWGAEYHDACVGVVIDSESNIRVAGNFLGTIGVEYDLDPTDGIDNHIPSVKWNMFFSKFTQGGSYVYGNIVGGGNENSIKKIALRTNNDLYVSGNSGGGGLLRHISSSFEYIWGGAIGLGMGSARGNGIDVDDSGNIYATGSFSGTGDFYLGPGEVNRTAEGHSDIYLAKYDSNYELVWVHTFGSNSFLGNFADTGYDLILDGSGSLYIVGRFISECDFDPGLGEDIQGVDDAYGLFLSKYDTLGNYLWTRTWGVGNEEDYNIPRSLELQNTGDILVVGTFSGLVDFDPGPGEELHTSAGAGDIFLSSFDPDGYLNFVETWGGSGADYGNCVSAYNDCIYVTGSFSGTVDFDPDGSSKIKTSAGGLDFFVLSLEQDGIFNWVGSCGGGDDDLAFAVASTEAGAFAVGSFEGFADFDPGVFVDERFAGGILQDAFLIYFPADGAGI